MALRGNGTVASRFGKRITFGRKIAVINSDPANDALLYQCAVNIEDLIKILDVMVEHGIGPNGFDCALLDCVLCLSEDEYQRIRTRFFHYNQGRLSCSSSMPVSSEDSLTNRYSAKMDTSPVTVAVYGS